MSHKHEWVEGGRILPNPDGSDEEVHVEHARLPRTGEPHDPNNKDHVALLKELGVEDFSQPPARTPKVIFDCACGETRHVPIPEDVWLDVMSRNLSNYELGTLPVHELIKEVPSK